MWALLAGLALAAWSPAGADRERSLCGEPDDDLKNIRIHGTIDSVVDMPEGWRSFTIAECAYLEIIVPPSAWPCVAGGKISAMGIFYRCRETGEDAEGNSCLDDVLDELTMVDCR